jgi:S1-C subfamily serine protease
VVEGARQGVAVHFLLRDQKGNEKRFTVPKERAAVIGIHRQVDLAVVDVSSAESELGGLKIEPVKLAPPGHRPQVGEHVFAIGHPGDEKGGQLTSTLSDGIVSGVGRKLDRGRYVQVTVPINPGNSGGPLFDDDGRVVGVNTLVIRRGRDIALEALNFALEGDFVHEIIGDPAGHSLAAREIAAILSPPQPRLLVRELAAKARRYEMAGFRPIRRLTQVFRLPAGGQRVIPITYNGGGADYAVVAVSQGANDIDMAVLNQARRVVASDVRVNPDPEVVFRVQRGNYMVVVWNPSPTAATVAAVILERR